MTFYPLIFSPFQTSRRVGQVVGQEKATLPKSYQKTQKHPEIKRFRGVFGAGNVTRTHDLLITKVGKVRKSLVFKAFRRFLLQNQQVVRRLCSTVSTG